MTRRSLVLALFLSLLAAPLVAADGQGITTGRSSPGSRTRKTLQKNLKCPKCERRFSLQMHVARHMSAKHGTTTRVQEKARKAITKKRK